MIQRPKALRFLSRVVGGKETDPEPGGKNEKKLFIFKQRQGKARNTLY